MKRSSCGSEEDQRGQASEAKEGGAYCCEVVAADDYPLGRQGGEEPERVPLHQTILQPHELRIPTLDRRSLLRGAQATESVSRPARFTASHTPPSARPPPSLTHLACDQERVMLEHHPRQPLLLLDLHLLLSPQRPPLVPVPQARPGAGHEVVPEWRDLVL